MPGVVGTVSSRAHHRSAAGTSVRRVLRLVSGTPPAAGTPCRAAPRRVARSGKCVRHRVPGRGLPVPGRRLPGLVHPGQLVDLDRDGARHRRGEKRVAARPRTRAPRRPPRVDHLVSQRSGRPGRPERAPPARGDRVDRPGAGRRLRHSARRHARRALRCVDGRSHRRVLPGTLAVRTGGQRSHPRRPDARPARHRRLSGRRSPRYRGWAFLPRTCWWPPRSGSPASGTTSTGSRSTTSTTTGCTCRRSSSTAPPTARYRSATSEALQVANPEIVDLVRVPGADHVESWNVDPTGYQLRETAFLTCVTADPPGRSCRSQEQ